MYIYNMVQQVDNWKKSEKCKEYHRQRYLAKKDNPEFQKQQLKNNWKTKGLITDDYEKIYQIYINTKNCQKCNVVLTTDKRPTPTRRSMDHNHLTGEFRSILCNKCNVHNLDDTNARKDNKSTGIKNICKTEFGYRFYKQIDGKVFRKRFKTLEEAIEFKKKFIEKNINK